MSPMSNYNQYQRLCRANRVMLALIIKIRSIQVAPTDEIGDKNKVLLIKFAFVQLKNRILGIHNDMMSLTYSETEADRCKATETVCAQGLEFELMLN